MIIILYFGIFWIISGWGCCSDVQTGISQIYARHTVTTGYFSMYAYLVQYIIPLLLYITLMMQEDKAYVVIRYIDREELWMIKIFGMIQYVVYFTLIHFGVNLALLFCCYPPGEVIQSRILFYLCLFVPNVFLYFIFVATVYLMFQIVFDGWAAMVLTSGLALFQYLIMVSGPDASCNPFFFLFLLGIQLQRGINEADVILAYTNVFAIDVIGIMTGLKLYRRKEFSYSYERTQMQRCVKNE